MMCFSGALCGDNHDARSPWWPTEQRWDMKPTEKVFTDCCYRRLRAMDTICSVRFQTMPHGGYGNYQDHEGLGIGPHHATWFDYASYYDPTWTVECNPDGGCKRFPIYKRGMHLREPM